MNFIHAWLLCPRCIRWHFKTAACLTDQARHNSSPLSHLWVIQEVMFLGDEEIYCLELMLPYIHPTIVFPPEFVELRNASGQFVQINSNAIKYIKEGE